MKKALLSIAFLCALAGAQTIPQVTTNLLTFPGPQPAQVQQVQAQVVGNPGNQTYYVWIVADYTIGNASPSPSFMVRNAPAVLSASNYIKVFWTPPSGSAPNSYDVLLTTDSGTPFGQCDCAAAVAVSGATESIQSNTLQSYTVTTYSGATTFNVNNQAVGGAESRLTFAANTGGQLWIDNLKGITALHPAITPNSIESVRLADQFCATSGTLDQTCIQNATNALPATGGEVFIPSGTYTLTSEIDNTVLQPVRYVCAQGAILTFTGGINGFEHLAGGSAIIGCTLRANNTTSGHAVNAGEGQWAASTAYAATAAVVPTLAKARGLFFYTTAACTSGGSEPTWPTTLGSTVTDGTCTWTADGLTAVTLRDNVFDGWGSQQVNTGGYNYGWVIENNEFMNGANEAILAGGGTQQTLVQGNYIHDMGSNGIDFGGGEYNTAAYNTIVNVGTDSGMGIDRDGIQMAAIVGFDAIGNRAVGNTIRTTGQSGIRIRGVTGQLAAQEVASGNNITSPGFDCVTVDDSAASSSVNILDQNSVVGNKCDTPGRFGIIISSSAGQKTSNTLIAGNMLSGATVSNYDLLVGSDALDTQVVSNYFLSTAPANPVSDQSATTSFVGNQSAASGGQPNIFRSAVNLAGGLSGPLAIAQGGTGAASLSAAGIATTAQLPGSGSVTTTAATSDSVAITWPDGGSRTPGHCALSATNASAATNIATTYISAKASNAVTLAHTATASMTYDVVCTVN